MTPDEEKAYYLKEKMNRLYLVTAYKYITVPTGWNSKEMVAVKTKLDTYREQIAILEKPNLLSIENPNKRRRIN